MPLVLKAQGETYAAKPDLRFVRRKYNMDAAMTTSIAAPAASRVLTSHPNSIRYSVKVFAIASLVPTKMPAPALIIAAAPHIAPM